jgi:hypothetical protein
MALNISGYTDPGTIIGEVNVPANISLATVPDVLAIAAYGSRKKRSIDEGVVRGQVLEESLTLAGTPPHIATLVNRGDRKISNTTVRRTLGTDIIQVPDAGVSYQAAQLTGTTTETFDVSTNNAIGLSLDGQQAVTMTFTDGASAVVITGTLIAVTTALAGVGATASAAEIAAGINAGLAAATVLGYGSAYAAVAADDGSGKVQITSPLSTFVSDVQVLAPFTADATSALGFTTPDLAPTIVEIDVLYFDAGATYEIDYVAVNTDIDPLTDTATGIIRVGSFAGVTSFFENTDYQLTAGSIDWSLDAAAAFTGSNTETFDLSTNDTIVLAFDGKAAITIDLDGLGSPPPGYADPATPATTTAAEIVNNINAVMSVAAGYGPAYRAVASDVSGQVKITSPIEGIASSVEFSAPSSLDATDAIFGLAPAQLPYTVIGTGSRPNVAAVYFATYEFDRPTADYNTPKRFFNEDQMTQDLTPVASANLLAVYGQIAFENNAPSIVVSQINDVTTPGVPTVNETNAAIDGLENSSVTTDVLAADTRINVQNHLFTHVENQSSPTEKNYRVGWFGMPNGTAIGDKDTPDTYVFRAAVTLQPSATSPARGRLYLVAPDSVTRTITNEDATETVLTLDSTAVACAIAARHTTFTSPATSLAGKTIIGFDIPTFPLFTKGERKQLASNGVMVITADEGSLEILDPLSTEAGGGNLAQFKYRSSISQKDNATRAVTRTVDRNLRGVVPDDLADFIFDIKIFISSALTSLISGGAIGPYRNNQTGASRDINLASDIQVEQASGDPTKFLFKYFFFLKYPALRFHGEFSTDNPFFSSTGN